jgi:hypothetical protein
MEAKLHPAFGLRWDTYSRMFTTLAKSQTLNNTDDGYFKAYHRLRHGFENFDAERLAKLDASVVHEILKADPDVTKDHMFANQIMTIMLRTAVELPHISYGFKYFNTLSDSLVAMNSVAFAQLASREYRAELQFANIDKVYKEVVERMGGYLSLLETDLRFFEIAKKLTMCGRVRADYMTSVLLPNSSGQTAGKLPEHIEFVEYLIKIEKKKMHDRALDDARDKGLDMSDHTTYSKFIDDLEDRYKHNPSPTLDKLNAISAKLKVYASILDAPATETYVAGHGSVGAEFLSEAFNLLYMVRLYVLNPYPLFQVSLFAWIAPLLINIGYRYKFVCDQVPEVERRFAEFDKAIRHIVTTLQANTRNTAYKEVTSVFANLLSALEPVSGQFSFEEKDGPLTGIVTRRVVRGGSLREIGRKEHHVYTYVWSMARSGSMDISDMLLHQSVLVARLTTEMSPFSGAGDSLRESPQPDDNFDGSLDLSDPTQSSPSPPLREEPPVKKAAPPTSGQGKKTVAAPATTPKKAPAAKPATKPSGKKAKPKDDSDDDEKLDKLLEESQKQFANRPAPKPVRPKQAPAASSGPGRTPEQDLANLVHQASTPAPAYRGDAYEACVDFHNKLQSGVYKL